MERPMLRAAVDNALSTGGHKVERDGNDYTCLACSLHLFVEDENDRDLIETVFEEPCVRECTKGMN